MSLCATRAHGISNGRSDLIVLTDNSHAFGSKTIFIGRNMVGAKLNKEHTHLGARLEFPTRSGVQRCPPVPILDGHVRLRLDEHTACLHVTRVGCDEERSAPIFVSGVEGGASLYEQPQEREPSRTAFGREV
mmetsp:Transcript_56802/g.133755  ORF Transcript_56802/g.133755 Transcript_56802/m.133755 type:complete len:132 (-) Transcript_56802:708-1103(-)